MHNAPSVMFPVGRCALYGILLACLGVLGAGVFAAWWLLDDGVQGRLWWGVAGAWVWAAWAVFAWWAWWAAPVGQLRWNALERREPSAPPGTWHWHDQSFPDGRPLLCVEVALDCQGAVLLRMQCGGSGVRWVWMERARNPARWNDLRRALTSAGA